MEFSGLLLFDCDDPCGRLLHGLTLLFANGDIPDTWHFKIYLRVWIHKQWDTLASDCHSIWARYSAFTSTRYQSRHLALFRFIWRSCSFLEFDPFYHSVRIIPHCWDKLIRYLLYMWMVYHIKDMFCKGSAFIGLLLRYLMLGLDLGS
jgi:hypothetical protein